MDKNNRCKHTSNYTMVQDKPSANKNNRCADKNKNQTIKNQYQMENFNV